MFTSLSWYKGLPGTDSSLLIGRKYFYVKISKSKRDILGSQEVDTYLLPGGQEFSEPGSDGVEGLLGMAYPILRFQLILNHDLEA